jgi:hypothetical protein
MIRGYPRYPSLFPAETLTLHISTDSPRFRVEFFRQGAELTRMDGIRSDVLDGSHLPNGPPDVDWGWTGYDFVIPEDWRSGVYITMLIEIDRDGRETAPDRTTTFATEAKALFVVRHRGTVPMGTPLYKISWATFVAYNATMYGSLYSEAVWSREYPYPGFKVTWRRPGCGAGGRVMPGDPPDYYDTSSRRQTFEHWDAPFVRWLEQEGYTPHYCTDWDLHQDQGLLAPYSLVLSTGHDEYWSQAMRDAIAGHIGRGGNAAFFSGNTSFYRIHFTDDNTAITCAKVLPPTKDPDCWTGDAWSEIDPECRVIGVSTVFGGGWWDGKRETQGYKVQNTGHWIFTGTRLAEGDTFGDDEDFPLIGYEVDGAAFRRVRGRALATGELGTPRDFVILGIAELTDAWAKVAPLSSEASSGASSRRGAAATMGMYVSPRGGIVFQGATTDWPILVPRNRHVEAITRNVVERLRLKSARIIGPLPTKGGRMIAAAGETVSFHVDLARFAQAKPELEWKVAGAAIVEEIGARISIELPAEPDFVNLSVIVKDGEEPVGFATRTFLPMSLQEAARADILTSLREMTMTDEPSNPMVIPTRDPAELTELVIPIRLPWFEERARQLGVSTVDLMRLNEAGAKTLNDDGEERLDREK